MGIQYSGPAGSCSTRLPAERSIGSYKSSYRIKRYVSEFEQNTRREIGSQVAIRLNKSSIYPGSSSLEILNAREHRLWAHRPDYSMATTSFPSIRDMNLRKTYLNNASRYLLSESLSSSAYIMAQNLEVSGTQHPQKPASICQTCGTILVPGFTSRRSTQSRRAAASPRFIVKGKSSKQVSPLITELLEECLTCRRSTKIDLPLVKPIRAKRHPIALKHVDGGKQQDAGQPEVTPSAQASNRKRKKHKGLLRRSQEESEQAKSDSGLNLMDFMKAV